MRRIRLSTLLPIALAGLAHGQQIPFQLLLTETNNAVTVQNGAAVNFNASIGQTETVSLTATFTGPGQAMVVAPVVTGSTTFTATFATAPPSTLNPGDSVTINLQFVPTSGTASNALISVAYTQTTPSGSTSTVTTGTILLSALGTSPSFVESYTLQTNQNVVPVQPGGTIAFPPTLVGATAQAAFNVTNTGSGPGTVTSISVSPGAFTLSNVPLFPASVAAGQTLQVLILYQPSGQNQDTGQITVGFSSGAPLTFNLQGSGISPLLTYQVLANPPVTVQAGGTITLPGTNVGQSSSFVIQVVNSGNASVSISLINATGQGFQVSGVPPLPQTLAPNASLTFTLIFTPTQPGTLTGILVVNSNILNLTGVGLGPQLQFSYTASGTTMTLGATNNSVIFSPVIITSSAQLSLDVKNTGTLPTTLSNIGVGQTNSPFSLMGLPPLPVQLAPGADFQISIIFTPASLGFSNGTLLLDSTSIALVGSGTQPPPLPSYSITGPAGTAVPASQPEISLTLANSYPVAITGTLTLTVAGSLPADPSLQFETGGRTIAFTIPANTRSAIFAAQGAQIGIQTGTVASPITLTPSFATQAGNVDLTPSPPATLQFDIAPAVPSLVAIQLVNEGTTGLTIQITGFSTTRVLTTWNVQFTTAPGYAMPVSQFSLVIQSISTVWFESTASQTFGGQFTVTLPFTLQGSVPAGQSLVNSIASVSATLSNDVGTSNSLSATVQ